MDELHFAGARFGICRVTLRLGRIGPGELYYAVEVEPAEGGVGQVAWQQWGFAQARI